MSVLVNTRESLPELQDLIAPVLVRNIFSLKKIPPLNFIPDAAAFSRAATQAGFITHHISEKCVPAHFNDGKSLTEWMQKGGPSAGFRSSLRQNKAPRIFKLIEDAVDKRNGLTVTFRYIAYSGIKQ